MTLPTIQPQDWPDWGTLPTFAHTSVNVAAVPGANELIVEFATGYFSHTLLVFNGNGDGTDYDVFLNWMDASTSEGGSIVAQQMLTVPSTFTITVPLTNWTPFLRITDAGASAYPHNVLLDYTLFTNRGYMVGYPGGIYALHQSDTVAGNAQMLGAMIGCGPGLHSANVNTTATLWSVTLETWVDYQTSAQTLLADQTTATPYNIEFLAPASGWRINFSNDDATPSDVTLICIRQP